MRNYLILFIALLSNSLFAQNTISDLAIYSEYGVFYDSSGNLLQGPYKITGDGVYSTAYFDPKGEMHGFHRTYYDNTLQYESEYFLGTAISYKELDKKGNIVEQEIYRNLEILDGKKSKFGSINSGKVKLTFLANQEDYGDYSIITIKDLRRDGICEEFRVNGQKLSQTEYDNGQLRILTVYNSSGEILKELPTRSAVDTTKYPLKFTSYLDYKIRQLGNGQYFWTDTSGQPLNGDYDFYFGNTSESDLRSYKNGYLHGTQYNFDASGFLQSVENYELGVLSGPVVEASGGTVTMKNYRNGKEHGLYLVYDYTRGIVTDSVIYKYGLKTGTEQIRRMAGKMERQISYRKGKMHGKVETYEQLQNGDKYVSKIELYQYGNKYGNHVEYDSSGNIIKQEGYKFDKLHGKSIDNLSGERYESVYKLGKQVANTSFRVDGIKSSEWFINGRKSTSIDYYEDGGIKEKTETIQWDIKRLPEDSMKVSYYDRSGALIKKKVALIEEDTDLSDPCCYWLFHYSNNKLARTEFVTEEYPNQTIKVYENDRVSQVIDSPMYPDHGEKRQVQYLNKQGVTIKTCSQTYFNENMYDDVEGIWEDEICN
jgi:antitoxin component YwqK of YwqJK toxin-antitoxin module